MSPPAAGRRGAAAEGLPGLAARRPGAAGRGAVRALRPVVASRQLAGRRRQQPPPLEGHVLAAERARACLRACPRPRVK